MNRRVLLKLSGEALQPKQGQKIIDTEFVRFMGTQILEAVEEAKIEVAIVIGGGNIFRGEMAQALGMDRVKGDFMGMMATVINAMALESVFSMIGLDTLAQSALAVGSAVPGFNQAKALAALEKKKVVIFAGGTGNPYFTTDTAAALRAVELHCNALLKATKVDGIYDDDPKKNHSAKLFPELTFHQVIERELRVMDQTAFSLCRENKMPINVFNVNTPGNIKRALLGEKIGSIVR
ncbi:MAG: UMP kinase [Myxococcales bacterium]|nr:MAG: UMP kinase [Myxococcales bacterium]